MPRFVNVEEIFFEIEYLNNHTRLVNCDGRFMGEVLDEAVDTGSGLLIIINGYTFSVIWSKQDFYIFDSHSRSATGMKVPNGTAVLLKFRSLKEVEKYIDHLYLSFLQAVWQLSFSF